jgi:uncharacterized LabA/DUF88 family protein
MPARSSDTYLFIDGEYVRRVYNEAIQSVFGCDGEIDLAEVKRQAGAKRAFFYDCLDDVQRTGESQTAYDARVASQESLFAAIRALKGFHVRLGSLRGAPKKLRQKEVDVLLAVDMLTHGFDGNMETAILIAGDLDFRPIIEALVRRGVFIEIWYEKKSGAQELWWAADFGRQLTFRWFYDWSTNSFRTRCPLPQFSDAHAPMMNITYERPGLYEGRDVRMLRDSDHGNFVLRIVEPSGVSVKWLEYPDEGVIERYFATIYGPIQWK